MVHCRTGARSGMKRSPITNTNLEAIALLLLASEWVFTGLLDFPMARNSGLCDRCVHQYSSLEGTDSSNRALRA